MQYHCHGRPCSEEPAPEIGDWVMSLADLLNSSVCSDGTAVNEALLKQNLVEQIGEGKSGAARQEWFRLNSPQWRRLELTVTRYLHRFIVHIRDEPVCGQAAAAWQHHPGRIHCLLIQQVPRQHSKPAHRPSQFGSTAQPSQSSSALQATHTESVLLPWSSSC